MILLCLLILFTHVPCTAPSTLSVLLTGACNVQFNNRMPPLSHGLTLTILFHTLDHLSFESLCGFFWFSWPLAFCSHPIHPLESPSNLVWGIYEQACDPACTCMHNLVSGERVSDLCNDIWVCSCIIRHSSGKLSVSMVATNAGRRSHLPHYPATNAYLQEERTSNFCQAPQALPFSPQD